MKTSSTPLAKTWRLSFSCPRPVASRGRGRSITQRDGGGAQCAMSSMKYSSPPSTATPGNISQTKNNASSSSPSSYTIEDAAAFSAHGAMITAMAPEDAQQYTDPSLVKELNGNGDGNGKVRGVKDSKPKKGIVTDSLTYTAADAAAFSAQGAMATAMAMGPVEECTLPSIKARENGSGGEDGNVG